MRRFVRDSYISPSPHEMALIDLLPANASRVLIFDAVPGRIAELVRSALPDAELIEFEEELDAGELFGCVISVDPCTEEGGEELGGVREWLSDDGILILCASNEWCVWRLRHLLAGKDCGD